MNSEWTGISYAYPGTARPALDGVSVSFETGKSHVLIGPNGSGKTTLLRYVAGLLGPSARPHAARETGLLLQETALPADLPVKDYVLCGRYPHIPFWGQPGADDRAAVAEALELCGLADFAARPLAELSSGQRQLVRIALLIAQEAPLLLLDEPTTFLDPAVQERIFRILRRLRAERGVSTVMTLHDLNAAAREADSLSVLRDGRLVAAGPTAEVFTADVLARAFDVPFHVFRDTRTGRLACLPEDA